MVGQGAWARQDWEAEDLIEVWTLLEDDMKKARSKSGAARFPKSAKGYGEAGEGPVSGGGRSHTAELKADPGVPVLEKSASRGARAEAGATLQGLDTAARKGECDGRSPVITDDMLRTVLGHRALGESVEQIQPDLNISTGKRRGRNPSAASVHPALPEHAKRHLTAQWPRC
ncbi:hypothetical protein ACFVFH_15550 [Streptomyces sp. NPDC057697]|uniref:hypothetical protein n=1 Tax=Streptomyces sp. NPDC057697 TaxID=3346219 RepID=UPI0036D1E0B0